MTREKFFNFSKMPFMPHAPGIVRKQIWGDNIMFITYQAKKGSVAPPHSHPNEQLSFIEKGKIEISVGERKYLLNPGDTLIIPSKEVHSIHILEDTVGFEIFSPPRKEWMV